MTAGQGYNLYVVELDPNVPRRRSRCRHEISSEAVAVYVGQSWYPPEVRFELHRQGVKASPSVRDHGVQLRPDLVTNPRWVRTKRAALRRELELAEELCRRGYLIFGGH
jgi:hypothetical protein